MRKLILVLIFFLSLISCEKKADCIDCITNYYNEKGYVYMANYVSLCDFTEVEVKEYIALNTSDRIITKCKK